MIELMVGTSLATAAGLNAWIPLFILGLADRFIPAVQLPGVWSWLSSDISLWVMGVLLVLEIIADKIPMLDSLNDVVQSIVRPASGGIAFGAGAGAQTVAVEDPSVFFNSQIWVPVLLGVLVALGVHLFKAGMRLAANTATAGLAAPILSTAEDGTSAALAISAIMIPILALVILVALVVTFVVLRRRRRQRKSAPVT